MPRDERPGRCSYCGGKKKNTRLRMCAGCRVQIKAGNTPQVKRPLTDIEKALAKQGITPKRY